MALSASTSSKVATSTMSSGRRGIFMILSPAKTLDRSPLSKDTPSCHIQEENASAPSCDPSKTRQLVEILQSKNQKQLKQLLNVSDKISSIVKDYYDNFNLHLNMGVQGDIALLQNTKPAIFSFDGPAFKGINPSTCNTNTLQYMQANLRVIDPLFGVLKPLDIIQPYRLEMATKGIMKELDTKEKHLADWWKASITTNILNDMKESQCDVLVNLASDEYASAVDVEELMKNECKFIKVAFQQEGKVVAVHAKRARGLMVRYISENQLTDLQDIYNFDLEGYKFRQDKSNENTIVFDRPKDYKDNPREEQSSSQENKRKSDKDPRSDQKMKKRTK